MNDSVSYSVVLSGNIKPGSEPESVTDAFSRLFKLPPEKARSVVGTKFVIKKGIDLKLAKTYKDKLSAIGLEVVLQKHGGNTLTLDPIESVAPKPGEPGAKEMICPKCGLQQPKAEECSGCGVFVQKVTQPQVTQPSTHGNAAASFTPGNAGANVSRAEDPAIDDRVNGFLVFLFPTIAAVLGALLWYGIANSLEYEFGAVAWLIGGAIGFAAAITGARGNATGMVCSILVVLSIFGGKYLATSSFQAEFAAEISGATEYQGIDLRELYKIGLKDAKAFSKLDSDEASLRKFIASRGYSEYGVASKVTAEEISGFRKFTQPMLEDIFKTRPSFEEWREYTLIGSVANYSTFDMMMESLEWIDILFLFFGIATAYRLGSRGF